MARETRDHQIPTRRDYMKYGGAVIVGGLLTGCIGGSSSNGGGSNATTTTDSRETNTGGTADTSNEPTTNSKEESYSVNMAPMGQVEFDTVPESAFVIFTQYADMAVALGHGDIVNSVYLPKMLGTTMNYYYKHLSGVSFDWKGLVDPLSSGVKKEQLYNLDSDVHFADPAFISTQEGWNQSDIDEVGSTIGPWFGNFYSGTNASVPSGYSDQYQYYSLWELFGKVAQVFRETERYQALNRVHRDVLSRIQSKLPPRKDRPTAVRVTLYDGQFSTYHLNKSGYWLADTRPLGAIDAFADQNWSDLWGTVGYEAMLEANPDMILHIWGMTPEKSHKDVVQTLNNHPIGQQLTAVQNDRVYPQGMRYQGPIMNLFQLEMTAKQLYPKQFGKWPEYQNGDPYPSIPNDEQLFDRQHVADIVNGNL